MRDIVAAPVGHIFCALALLNSPSVHIADKAAFLAGTSFPDIRYLGGISRTATHGKGNVQQPFGADGETAFEAGRRFHVLIDKEREAFMQKSQAYRHLDEGPLQTHTLKLVEDHILFDRLAGQIDSASLFRRSYREEYAYGLKPEQIQKWHEILGNYLDSDYRFDFWRYMTTIYILKDSVDLSKRMFRDIFSAVRNIGFLVYAYFKVKKLSQDEELRKIILSFYDIELPKIISRVR